MKFATDMNFEEFVQWAREYVVSEFLDRGLTGVKSAIHTIVNQASMNKVFGGEKQKEKK